MKAIAGIMIILLSVSACNERGGRLGWVADEPVRQDSQESFTACLDNAMRGGHNLSAEEIVYLCEEISGLEDPHYDYVDGEFVPGNEFTRCVDDEKSALAALGKDKAQRLARLSCKYPNFKP